LYERFLFSGDLEYLREIYPIMKGAAEFLLDFMVPDPTHQWRVVGPSVSPENSFNSGHDKGTVTYGTAMDIMLGYELFQNIIWAAETLKIDPDFVELLNKTREKLPPLQIGRLGQLQEWLFDWDREDDHNRHVSHMYGIYPGRLLSPYRTREFFDASVISLKYRGDVATGWSMGWKVCLWARFQDGNHAYKLITDQLNLTGSPKTPWTGGGTYPDMFDACPPFQIDGNFGCCAGIAEMFMQSHDTAMHILPALPDIWDHGKITGLRARGGFELRSLVWESGKIQMMTIRSQLGGNLRLRTYTEIKCLNAKMTPATGENPNPSFGWRGCLLPKLWKCPGW
jgi:alpha-L-fucosidase 2